MIVGTAGHVDHGKTSLVRVLTGVDTDRLKEEKARGITIDLGFAYMPAAGGTIGFVDVPGHEKLVRTMVAGASGIDYALLVVAADDGPMPQTREHLDILGLLGLTRGVIAITKCDRVDAARRAAVAGEIAAAIAGTALAEAEVLMVSAASGEGIDALRTHLADVAAAPGGRDAGGIFRMAVDRAFTLQGVGTVATGTARAGRIRVDDEVTIMPGGLKARVRSLHAQNREAGEGRAGERCALALSGAGVTKDLLPRGAWICGAPNPAETIRFDAEVSILKGAAVGLGQWTPLRLHCGASEVGARATVLEDAPAAGGSGLVQFVIDRALPLRHGDLVVLRDQSARHTIGGGRVLDPRAPLRKRRSAERLARLVILRAPDPAAALGGLLAQASGFEDLSLFAEDRGLTPTEAEALRRGLVALPAGAATFVCTPAHWDATAAAWITALAAFHAENPELPGLAGDRLRLALAPPVPKDLFAAIRERLAAEKRIRVHGHWLLLPDHVAQLSADESRLRDLMVPLIEKQRFRPPRVRDISGELAQGETHVRRACKALVRTGAFMELAPDHFFLRETVIEMAEIARDLSQQSETHLFTAADFRDRLDNGRKVAIQILECFDRQGLTLRNGDLRRVVKAPVAIFGRPEARG